MHSLLEKCLDQNPDPMLLETWVAYVKEICGSLKPEVIGRFKTRVLGEAQSVAEAAGGILGLGAKVSDGERMVLEQMSAAFPK
jgi:hypothetical protein